MKARLRALLYLVLMIDLSVLQPTWRHDVDKQNHHGVVGEMLTVTHETRAEKGDAEIDRAPTDLGCVHCLRSLCLLTNSKLHKATVLSKNRSFHLIENWSTRRRARYFHAPPARSHGAFWVGDTDAAGRTRHPICSASSLKDDSNSPPKSNRRHSGTPSVRHQPRRNP